MSRLELTFCQTGVVKHAPTLRDALAADGHDVRTIECFDKCETCERVLLARIDGTLARFRTETELRDALAALQEAE